MSHIDVRLDNVGKRYRLGTRRSADTFWALKDFSLEVHRGSSVGIIGPNGAGKSTVMKLLAGITAPSAGRITIVGALSALIEVGSGFHPELTGRENIFLSGSILGMRRRDIAARLDRIVSFAGRSIHRYAGEVVFVRHTSGSDSPLPRTCSQTCCWSTRCSPSATPSSGPMPGAHPRTAAGGSDDPLHLARPVRGGATILTRPCCSITALRSLKDRRPRSLPFITGGTKDQRVAVPGDHPAYAQHALKLTNLTFHARSVHRRRSSEPPIRSSCRSIRGRHPARPDQVRGLVLLD